MSQRDRSPELTVVERFTTTSASAVFERELLAYARLRESRRGFVSRVTAALTDRPGAYVHLDWWSGLDRLLRVIHEDPPHGPRGLPDTVSAESELLVSVGRMTVSGTPAEAARLVLIRALVLDEAARFELDFGSLVGQCVPHDGFGGSDLLRSVADPSVYIGLLWWQDPTACALTLSGAAYRDHYAKLAATSRTTECRARPLSPL
ncbi:hypothetical protein AB0K93_22775 [Streptomyces sp. NPDC052676]|uniref:hypothetical protein n=1 Tax=Streptomyces sp. NPDC052676 TaxID=3154953 RepID=UPI003442CE6B